MGSKKKKKNKSKSKIVSARRNQSDLAKILKDKRIDFKVRNCFTETYETYSGFFRGVYRLNGYMMVALDETDEENPLYLRRHYLHLSDMTEIVLEGDKTARASKYDK